MTWVAGFNPVLPVVDGSVQWKEIGKQTKMYLMLVLPLPSEKQLGIMNSAVVGSRLSPLFARS